MTLIFHFQKFSSFDNKICGHIIYNNIILRAVVLNASQYDIAFIQPYFAIVVQIWKK